MKVEDPVDAGIGRGSHRRIPKIESLNVHIALGIAVYHILHGRLKG